MNGLQTLGIDLLLAVPTKNSVRLDPIELTGSAV